MCIGKIFYYHEYEEPSRIGTLGGQDASTVVKYS